MVTLDIFWDLLCLHQGLLVDNQLSICHLCVTFREILQVGIGLLTFPPSTPTIAVDSQKFGGFYFLNRTVLSEYSGS